MPKPCVGDDNLHLPRFMMPRRRLLLLLGSTILGVQFRALPSQAAPMLFLSFDVGSEHSVTL